MHCKRATSSSRTPKLALAALCSLLLLALLAAVAVAPRPAAAGLVTPCAVRAKTSAKLNATMGLLQGKRRKMSQTGGEAIVGCDGEALIG